MLARIVSAYIYIQTQENKNREGKIVIYGNYPYGNYPYGNI